MKRVPRLLAIVLVFVLMLVPLHASAVNYANHIADARTGVVRILSGADDSIYVGYGSGFAVGTAGQPTDVFATNYHVVKDADFCYVLLDNDWRSSVPECGGIADGVHAVPCRIVYENTSGPDYAIIQSERIITERVANALMYSHLAYPGDTVFTLGYPASSDEVTEVKEADIDAMTITTGTISRFTYYEEKKTNVVQIDSVINHGNSGGPLLTEQGYVIGLNTWGVPDPKTDQIVYLAVEIDYVIEKLNELIANGELVGFSYTLIDQRPEDDVPPAPVPSSEATVPAETEPVVTEPVITKPMETESLETTGVSNETTENATDVTVEEPSNTLIYLAVGAIVLGALIVIAILIINKRKSAASSAHAVNVDSSRVSAAAPTVQYTLTGISGSFAGKKAPISKILTFGRTSNCDILFVEGTAGVSRTHCQLIPAENGIQLVDLGSTAGTFLANGTKLVPHQPYSLKHGDVFYIGSKTQAFRIEQFGASVNAAPVQASVSYSITGMEGAFAGKKMTLSREMVFGRNPSCDVVFPNNTSGISSRHFVLTPRENGIVLMDLGSTYGTFLANGNKLAPNQQVLLHRGDSFCAGGMKHRFRID